MSFVTVLFVSAAVLSLFFLWLRADSLDRVITKAIKTNDVEGVLLAIRKKSATAQTTAYNHAIRRLWGAYERPLAVPLIRALAQGHGDTKIGQYWLKQLFSAEPRLAREQLGQAFLSEHYRADLAAQCGPVG